MSGGRTGWGCSGRWAAGCEPALVAAMALLAALALAGSSAATGLAGRWQAGAGGLVTVQVPQPDRASAGR